MFLRFPEILHIIKKKLVGTVFELKLCDIHLLDRTNIIVEGTQSLPVGLDGISSPPILAGEIDVQEIVGF